MVERVKSSVEGFGRIALRVRDLGLTDYRTMFDAMRAFTDARDATSTDEIWLTEHEAVFTQGQAGKSEHLLAPGDIPVVATDRGGQVTYHGPGQIVAYTMFDVGRMRIGVRALVAGIESAMIAVLRDWNIEAEARGDARGVYVGGRKIGALGLRVRRGCAYHGLALNVTMDLEFACSTRVRVPRPRAQRDHGPGAFHAQWRLSRASTRAASWEWMSRKSPISAVRRIWMLRERRWCGHWRCVSVSTRSRRNPADGSGASSPS